MPCSCDKNKVKVPGMSSGGKTMKVATKKVSKKATSVKFGKYRK